MIIINIDKYDTPHTSNYSYITGGYYDIHNYFMRNILQQYI